MRPAAASSTILPVGVGLMSRGPIGVDGLTITGGHPFVADQPAHLLLGEVFGALVHADHRGFVDRRVLRPRRAVADQPERGDAAAIDDPLHPGVARRPQQVAGAVHVGLHHRPGVRHPEPIIGGHVHDVGAAFDGGCEARRVAQVALDQLGRQAGDVARGRCRAAPAAAARARAPGSARATAEPTKPVAPVTSVVGGVGTS